MAIREKLVKAWDRICGNGQYSYEYPASAMWTKNTAYPSEPDLSRTSPVDRANYQVRKMLQQSEGALHNLMNKIDQLDRLLLPAHGRESKAHNAERKLALIALAVNKMHEDILADPKRGPDDLMPESMDGREHEVIAGILKTLEDINNKGDIDIVERWAKMAIEAADTKPQRAARTR